MLEAVLLVTLPSLVYVAGLLVTARHYYQRWRPSKVPLCGKEEGDNHMHFHLPAAGVSYDDRYVQFEKSGGCYRNYGRNTFRPGYDTEGEAVTDALITGLAWPAIALVLGLNAAVRAGAPEFPAEREARLKILGERITALEEGLEEEGGKDT